MLLCKGAPFRRAAARKKNNGGSGRVTKTKMTEQPQPISQHLAKRLLACATVAGAAAIATQPADAEVIYTPANQSIAKNASLFIDLDNDGATDLTIHESCFATNIDPPQNRLVETPSSNLEVMEKFGRPEISLKKESEPGKPIIAGDEGNSTALPPCPREQ
jgi:hypothetical protein